MSDDSPPSSPPSSPPPPSPPPHDEEEETTEEPILHQDEPLSPHELYEEPPNPIDSLSTPPSPPPPPAPAPPPLGREGGANFALIAWIASGVCVTVFAIILIYSLLFAPSPPPQPILIEAKGVTKSLPKNAQLPEDPNSKASVFKMLRGEELASKPRDTAASPDKDKEKEKEKKKVVKPGVNTLKPATQPTAAAKPETTETKQDETKKKPQEKPQAKLESKSSGWYVQVAALGSQAAADRAWAALHDRFPELLYQQNYHARLATLDSGASVWRLLLGPSEKTQAQTLCLALKKRDQSCLLKRLRLQK